MFNDQGTYGVERMRRLLAALSARALARHARNVRKANPWPSGHGAVTTRKTAEMASEALSSPVETIELPTGRPLEVDGWEALRDVPGLTYRKFDYWCTEGYIRFAPRTFDRSGCVRAITEDEVHVITLMTELVTLGMSPQTAEPLARTLALGITATFGGFKIRCAA